MATTIFKPKIEVLAEMNLCTYAVIKSYVENAQYVFGIIKYDAVSKHKYIGFRYNILLDKLTLMKINEMAKNAYFTICK